MIVGCNISMICLELNFFFYDPSRILQLSEFVWTLPWCIDVSQYPLSFSANTPFNGMHVKNNNETIWGGINVWRIMWRSLLWLTKLNASYWAGQHVYRKLKWLNVVRFKPIGGQEIWQDLFKPMRLQNYSNFIKDVELAVMVFLTFFIKFNFRITGNSRRFAPFFLGF